MAELAHQVSVTPLDLSSEAAVLTYTYTGSLDIEVLACITLGDNTANLAGTGGAYILRTTLNGVLVTPISSVLVPVGTLRTILISRAVPLTPGDLLQITVQGSPADTAVRTTASLREATQASIGDVLGAGAVRVDHNYPTTGNLLIQTAEGVGIDNAVVAVYRQSDWTAGQRSTDYILSRTTTTVGGSWSSPLYLDPGTYILVAYRQPDFAETTTVLVVS